MPFRVFVNQVLAIVDIATKIPGDPTVPLLSIPLLPPPYFPTACSLSRIILAANCRGGAI